jgi:hypothetical protein
VQFAEWRDLNYGIELFHAVFYPLPPLKKNNKENPNSAVEERP